MSWPPTMTQCSKSASFATANVKTGAVKRVTNVDDACWEFSQFLPTIATMIEVATLYPSSNCRQTRLKCGRLRLAQGVDWDQLLPRCFY